MFCRKFILFFVFVTVVSTVSAKDSTMSFVLTDEAQVKAGRISDIEVELKRSFSDAASSDDYKLRACVGNYFGKVNGLAASADGIVSQITLLLMSGKMLEAHFQMSALDGLVDIAEQASVKARSCRKADRNKRM